jgi:hypothetical protein
MQPIRQIYQHAPDTINIPEELRQQAVEVIIWPLGKSETEQKIETDANGWPIGFFEATAGCLADDPIERAPQGDYEQRLELE